MSGVWGRAGAWREAWPVRLFMRPPDLNAQADAARDSRNWHAAAQLYWQAAERASEPFGLWVQCGNCAKEAGELDIAETAYAAARSINPDDADLHLQFGHLRKRQGRAREALAHYHMSMTLDGNAFATDEFRALAAQLDERATKGALFWGKGAAPFDVAYMATMGADPDGMPEGARGTKPLPDAPSGGYQRSAGTLRADAILADLWHGARPHGAQAGAPIHISVSL